MSTEQCRHGVSVPQQMLLNLAESQGGIGRHKCASCAYQIGINDAEVKIQTYGEIIKCNHGCYAPKRILLSLDDSQGGSGRHKCVVCAYQNGRAISRGISSEEAWLPKNKKQKGSINRVKDFAVGSILKPDNDWWDRENTRCKEIGDLGELLVLEYEKSILISSDKLDLAKKVTHVSKVEGDSIGYDIRSFDTNGDVKYIEVKTSVGGKETPFFMSENERRFSFSEGSQHYHLYRLFNLDEINEKADFYVVRGEIERAFNLSPTMYKVFLDQQP